MNLIIRTAIIASFMVCGTVALLAQPELNIPANDHSFRERIEHLRKTRLLDALNLQGDSVRVFFAAYDAAQQNVLTSKEIVNSAAEELRLAIQAKAQTSTLVRLTEALQKRSEELEKTLHDRSTRVKPTLSPMQYASYVLFETKFHEELQRLILQRVRQGAR